MEERIPHKKNVLAKVPRVRNTRQTDNCTAGELNSPWFHKSRPPPGTRHNPVHGELSHSCKWTTTPPERFHGNWLNERYDHPNTTETLPIPLLSLKGKKPKPFSFPPLLPKGHVAIQVYSHSLLS